MKPVAEPIVEFLGWEDHPDEKRRKAEEAARALAQQDETGEGVDLAAARRLKERGNACFGRGEYDEAIALYERGVLRCPEMELPKRPTASNPKPAQKTPQDAAPSTSSSVDDLTDASAKHHFDAQEMGEEKAAASEQPGSEEAAQEKGPVPEETKEGYAVRSQLLCNCAAAMMKLDEYDTAVERLNECLRHNDAYEKAYYRRIDCNEHLENWASVKSDIEACHKKGFVSLPNMYQRQQVADKKSEEQMNKALGDLKDLGNRFLGKFGLSTDNFNFVKDPKTGGYSMNFQQNNGPAGQ